jgi:O-antigen/teichoic acid export membrane protein
LFGELIKRQGRRKVLEVGSVYFSSIINAVSAFLVIALLSRVVDEVLLSTINFYLIIISFGMAFDLGISIFVPRAVQVKKNRDPNFQHIFYFSFSLVFLFLAYLLIFILLISIFDALPLEGFEQKFLLFTSIFLIVTNKFSRLLAYSLNSYLIPSLASAFIVILRLFLLAIASQVMSMSLTVVLWIFFTTALVQKIVLVLHLFAIFNDTRFRKGIDPLVAKIQFTEYMRNLGSAWKLTIASGAGAIATQLDKVIIAISHGVVATAPIYYANSLSMVGLSLLALPLYQYFQPHITRAILASDTILVKSILLRYSTSILLVSCVFFIILFFSREVIVQLWLGEQDAGDMAAVMLPIMLIGAIFAMISIIPYSILVAKEDFLFLCIASFLLTVLFIPSLWFVSENMPIIYCCYIISGYHISSCMVLILRTLAYPRNQVLSYE